MTLLFGLRVTGPNGLRSKSVGKLNWVGTGVPALTCGFQSTHHTDLNVVAIHPLDKGYHEIFAAWVLLMVSVPLSFIHNSWCLSRPFSHCHFLKCQTLRLNLNSALTKQKASTSKISFPWPNFGTSGPSDQWTVTVIWASLTTAVYRLGWSAVSFVGFQ